MKTTTKRVVCGQKVMDRITLAHITVYVQMRLALMIEAILATDVTYSSVSKDGWPS